MGNRDAGAINGNCDMAGAKHHDYHLVNPSVWPMIGSLAALVMFFGAVMWMHTDYFGGSGAKASALELAAHMARRLDIPLTIRAMRASGVSEEEILRVTATLEKYKALV